jgi:hypothetical protein
VTAFNARELNLAKIASATGYVTKCPHLCKVPLLERVMSRAVVGLVATMLCLLALPATADVYKYVDKDGHPQFTDKPELLPAELLAKTQRTDKATVSERSAAEQQQNESISASQANSADKKKAQTTKAADKAARCAKARERYDQVMSAQRIYTTDEKGEKKYMDDKQQEQTRASAKQLMDTWCN